MKKLIYSLVAVVVSAVAVITLCSFTAGESEMDIHTSCQGKHCRATVGCSCPGFQPIKYEEVWKQAYCKHCGHHRSFHN